MIDLAAKSRDPKGGFHVPSPEWGILECAGASSSMAVTK
jgi:hypothetical protein